MRKPFIAGNWKMHKTVAEARALAAELRDGIGNAPHRVAVAPPFTALAGVVEALEGSGIEVAAQNMAAELEGAHTGEISATMLLDLGVKLVILGHSERRHVYGESDELINTKVLLALEQGLEVILCIGETLEEREGGKLKDVVVHQIDSGLRGLDEKALGRVTIAYEPVWAIGTGKTATPDDAEEAHRIVRTRIGELYSAQAAESMIIQYGGSVKPNNVKGLMAEADIDGALVGGASLKAADFIPIARFDQ
ncbi:MAG: triose-phosphate isomerase [Spirochaetaceae bacterium]|nr:MAG: triose-phosphate isomerase [Spirochaetaceae bacterium]